QAGPSSGRKPVPPPGPPPQPRTSISPCPTPSGGGCCPGRRSGPLLIPVYNALCPAEGKKAPSFAYKVVGFPHGGVRGASRGAQTSHRAATSLHLVRVRTLKTRGQYRAC